MPARRSGARMTLRIGTSGIPRSSARPDTVHGIRRARELGLDHLEMAWVNGVRMGDAAADAIAGAARLEDVTLTAHAPYYINLCGSDEVVARSLGRLAEAGRLGARCGAASFCFHAGFYQEMPPEDARRAVEARLREVAGGVRANGQSIDVRPELTGKPSQVGSLDEILDWCAAVPGVQPCVDFSHQYARSGGAVNSRDAFAGMLESIERRLGRAALERLHVHVSGIEYGPKGERNHVPLEESRFRWRDVLRALKDLRVSGWLVCESPAMEEDALRLKRSWRRMS
jgi:deoxyribonuclease-4